VLSSRPTVRLRRHLDLLLKVDAACDVFMASKKVSSERKRVFILVTYSYIVLHVQHEEISVDCS